MSKKFRLTLLPKIAIAIAAGIAIGLISPTWFTSLCLTFNEVFGSFLGFLIPLIILGFVTPAIGDLGKSAGKMLLVTAAIAYTATLFAGFTSFFISDWLFPSMLDTVPPTTELNASSPQTQPWFTMPMPPVMGVMTSLVLSFMLGLGIAFAKGNVLRGAAMEFRDIVAKTINKAIIPLLPFYIFGIFVNMTYTGQVGTVLSAFVKVIIVIFCLHLFILILQFCIASLFNRRNPFKMLMNMMPAYFTALGTQSSAATIPVTLRQTIKIGVREDVAGFVVPLCATIHMSGSTLKIVACALAVMILEGMPYDLPLFIHFICMVGVTIIAAPGIPGGAIMASLGLLTGILGFSETQNALMIALYIAMDSFGTACNVTGDGALAVIINRLFKNNKTETQNNNI